MDALVEDRAVDLEVLADRFAVSKMTIHRDLDDLEHAGLLRKVRGGATIEAGTRFESDFRIREKQDSAAKSRMAKAALAQENSSDPFYKNKLATARYYFERVLPDATSHLAKVKTGATPVMALSADAF